MIEFSDGQKKVISNGLTILSLVVVFTFTAFVAWLSLKLLDFTAPAVGTRLRPVTLRLGNSALATSNG